MATEFDKSKIIKLKDLDSLDRIQEKSIVEANDGTYLACKFPLTKRNDGKGGHIHEIVFVRKEEDDYANQTLAISKEKSYVKEGILGIENAKITNDGPDNLHPGARLALDIFNSNRGLIARAGL